MEQTTHSIVQAISKKINKAPHDWKKTIADKMEKSEHSVYAYSRGLRGIRRGYPLEVLKHLNTLIEEQQKEIEKLTA